MAVEPDPQIGNDTFADRRQLELFHIVEDSLDREYPKKYQGDPVQRRRVAFGVRHQRGVHEIPDHQREDETHRGRNRHRDDGKGQASLVGTHEAAQPAKLAKLSRLDGIGDSVFGSSGERRTAGASRGHVKSLVIGRLLPGPANYAAVREGIWVPNRLRGDAPRAGSDHALRLQMPSLRAIA